MGKKSFEDAVQTRFLWSGSATQVIFSFLMGSFFKNVVILSVTKTCFDHCQSAVYFWHRLSLYDITAEKCRSRKGFVPFAVLQRYDSETSRNDHSWAAKGLSLSRYCNVMKTELSPWDKWEPQRVCPFRGIATNERLPDAPCWFLPQRVCPFCGIEQWQCSEWSPKLQSFQPGITRDERKTKRSVTENLRDNVTPVQ